MMAGRNADVDSMHNSMHNSKASKAGGGAPGFCSRSCSEHEKQQVRMCTSVPEANTEYNKCRKCVGASSPPCTIF
eukprot:365190-Chlamydomonas_euryale.AAC.9